MSEISFLQQETEDYLLQEDSYRLLLEESIRKQVRPKFVDSPLNPPPTFELYIVE